MNAGPGPRHLDAHDQMGHHSFLGLPDVEVTPNGPLLRVITDRRVAFLAVGAMNTAIGLGAFVGFDRIFGHRYLVTLLAAHAVSVLIAFVLYRKLVFRVRGDLLGDMWRFETVYLISLAGNAVLLALGVSVLGAPVLLCQVAITVLQALWSWFGHGRFSFRRPTAEATVREKSR